MNIPIFKPVTHVIFNLDGILIDTERIHRKTFTRIANDCGKVFPDDLRVQILGLQEMDVANLIIDTLQLNLTSKELLRKARIEEEKELNKKNLRLKYGVEDLLKHLHQNEVPMAVTTSSSEKGFHMKTDHIKDIFSVFHHVVTGSSDPEVKNGKPAPDIFKLCASRFPENPAYSNFLVFDDSPNGVTAALAAGMQVVMVPDPILSIWHNMSTANATYVLNSLEDFRPEMFSLPPYFTGS